MPFETIIRHCSPTLANIKIANLFTTKLTKNIFCEVKRINALLNSKGIFFEILRISNNTALIYAYRKSKLNELLKNSAIKSFLNQMGYTNLKLKYIFKTLKSHLLKTDFPHEIGVFLGYPLSDIKAFICDKGANAKYVGCWKAYSNEEYARKIFEKYRKCTNIYCEKFANGFDILKLTVAC